MTATLNIHLTEGLTHQELELLAARAEDEGRTIEQIIMDAIRSKLAAQRPEPPAIAA
jgi:hypothetical protein